MPGAYIGAPPPHLRKRKQREPSPSPVVPDPVEPTPPRRDAFGTPARSARVYKTYAHKRARSYASSAAGDGPEEEEESSSSSSSAEESPTKVKFGPLPEKITPLANRPPAGHPIQHTERDNNTALVTALNDHHKASTSAGASAPAAKNVPDQHHALRRKQSSVYVEVPSVAEALGPGARIGPPRGRRQKPKSKTTSAMPSPPPTSDDNSAVNLPQYRAPSAAHLSLSDALNTSFGNASAGPSRPNALPVENSSSPSKRKRGRPPGKANSLAGLGPIINPGGASSSPTRSAAVPHAASTHAVAPASIHVAASISAPAVAPAVPVKRGPGRPRKHPLPVASTSASISRPPTSAGPSRSHKKGPEPIVIDEDSDADAVAAQLLDNDASSPEGAPLSARPKPRKDKHAYQSVDIGPIARALERQAADEAAHPRLTGHVPAPVGLPAKRPRGRPRGSKNKSTLEREAEARARRVASLPSPSRVVAAHVASTSTGAAPTLTPVPIKRPRGRPRKSAPAGSSLEYFEPLKDPDDDGPTAGPSTPAPKRRGRSSTRRNSTSALPYSPPTPVAPPTPSPYYLDLNTMQWVRRARARSASAPPSRRRSSAFITAAVGEAREGVSEYQTCKALCDALKVALLKTSPKLGKSSGKGKGKGKHRRKSSDTADGGLKVAQSGVLLVADDSDDEGDAGVGVFRGAWSVLGDPNVALDDGLVLKKLHEVVMGIGAYTSLDKAQFTKGTDGRTVTVCVPCCCASIRPGRQQALAASASGADVPEECEGEMVVSVAEGQPERAFVGIAKALRTVVAVAH